MSKYPKILAICPIDLAAVGGAVPMFWQIFRHLSELGAEIIVIPIKGRAFRSLWWRYYDNPISEFSLRNLSKSIYDRIRRPINARLSYDIGSDSKKTKYLQVSPIIRLLKDFKDEFWSVSYQGPWKRRLEDVWKKEKGIDVVILFSDLVNYMDWLPKYVHRFCGVPIIAYSADLPTYLWNQETFRMSSFYNVNLSEYDAFIVNSDGVVKKLKALGVSNVYVLYFGADPDLFSPLEVKRDIDISFYGYGAHLREDAMKCMITQPSQNLKDVDFRVAGSFGIDLGLCRNIGRLNFASMKRFCCRSKIALNITRKTFAETYCSSTARPFELAAMQCCVVSNPCKGMEKWFTPSKEIFEVSDEKEAIELYQWLISSEEVRHKIGSNARQKVLQKHTYKHRANELLRIIQKTI